MNMQHASRDELLALLNGESSEQLDLQITAHLDDCAHCRNSLEELAGSRQWWNRISSMMSSGNIDIASEPAAAKHLATHSRLATDARGCSVSEQESAELPTRAELGLAEPSHPELLGRLENYDIEHVIGQGGMGVVVKAFDGELNRPLAIKLMLPHLARFGSARQRFAREARAAAAVLHPNVIAIHGVNSDARLPYLVMPLIAGQSIEQLVNDHGPLAEIELVRIALQIASGLAAAHSQGLVHRDIKPANILIEKDLCRVIITDFGLARAEDDASMTKTGWLAGTPNFMSPEQARGFPIDHRSDLFSLGSVMYFMATGRLPFRAESPMAVLNRIGNDDPTPARSVNPELSRTAGNFIGRLLAKDPAHRFHTAADLHDNLEQHLAFLRQPEIRKPPRIKIKKRRRPLTFGWRSIAIGGALLAVFLLALYPGFGFLTQSRPEDDPADSFLSAIGKYGIQSDDDLNQELSTLGSSILQLDQELNTTSETRPDDDEIWESDFAELESALMSIGQVLRDP